MIVAFDTETELLQQGLIAPPLVCGSFAHPDNAYVADAKKTALVLRNMLDAGLDIITANGAFDMAVMIAYDPLLCDPIFKAYDEGRIHDVLIRQALDAIAGGHLYMHPDGGPLRDPESGKIMNRYSLALCAQLCLGKTLSKKDTWRLRYVELKDIPIEEWPQEAVDYSRMDAETTLEVFSAQRSFRNLHDEAAQCRAAFALHLSSVWGFRTDQGAVADATKRITEKYEADIARFTAAGLLRAKDGSCDTKKLKDLATKAYQGNPPMTAGGETRGPTVSTSADTLDESGDPFLEEYAAIGKNKTLHNTFLPILEAGTFAGINPGINVLVESGRVSYYKPNFQNLPRVGGIRECFAARGPIYEEVEVSGDYILKPGESIIA